VQESPEQAFARYQRVLASDPRQIEARLNAAALLSGHDYRLDAIQMLFEGFAHTPRDTRLRAALVGALDSFPLDEASPAVREVLLDLCWDDDIATQALADAIVGLTLHSEEFAQLQEALDAGAAQELARDPLLQALLRRAIVNDPALERVLTRVRRAVLLEGLALDAEFMEALAQQCFNNEYAWFVTPEETAALKAGSAVAAALYSPGAKQAAQLVEESALARSIEALTPIRGGVSSDVRDMYEENPYPRWLTLMRPRPIPRAEGAPGSVFIAGGGTGQHPLYTALAFPESDVLVVDLSRASLAYATRMAQRYRADNVRFRQADILELGLLTQRFDLIESFGVLHHLQDPMAGWKILVGLLKDGGAMRIGLYSAIARRELQAARELARERSFPGTPEGIRACRQAIIDLPEAHPARIVLESDDFFSASGCRDLVMHVQEHSFTLPQIAQCLHDLGLRFMGFEHSPGVLARFQAANPGHPLSDLAAWDRFEQGNPEVFRGMYRFVCTRV
jgi:SAM-dependent methyltransferase